MLITETEKARGLEWSRVFFVAVRGLAVFVVFAGGVGHSKNIRTARVADSILA